MVSSHDLAEALGPAGGWIQADHVVRSCALLGVISGVCYLLAGRVHTHTPVFIHTAWNGERTKTRAWETDFAADLNRSRSGYFKHREFSSFSYKGDERAGAEGS